MSAGWSSTSVCIALALVSLEDNDLPISVDGATVTPCESPTDHRHCDSTLALLITHVNSRQHGCQSVSRFIVC